MSDSVVIAYLGKGGSGKSILSALTGKIAASMKKKVLLIDADPAMGLVTALGIEVNKTIGQAREEIIREAKISGSREEKEHLSDIIDYLLLSALQEEKGYSLLAMGRTNTIGCYCPVNSLLRDTIEEISENFDIIVIDAEAGIEQINRQVTKAVQYPIILTDNSMRGVKTAVLALQAIEESPEMNPEKTGVIFNRIDSERDDLINVILESGLSFYGSIPPDAIITERDALGLSALDMPEGSPAFNALKEILMKEKVLN